MDVALANDNDPSRVIYAIVWTPPRRHPHCRPNPRPLPIYVGQTMGSCWDRARRHLSNTATTAARRRSGPTFHRLVVEPNEGTRRRRHP